MEIVRTKAELRQRLHDWRAAGETLALVPTMGNLHGGHLRLVEVARGLARRTAVSIFVNPLQFGPGEDLARYPRTPEQDLDRLRAVACDLVFLPEVAEIYPRDPRTMTFVEVPRLGERLCGQSRPGHFRGVATVVSKLFHLFQPNHAVFGEKDWQQLILIRRMVADLDLPVEIVGVPTVREPDGLALSSRNGYLSADERRRAVGLYRCLTGVAARSEAGATDFAELERDAETLLKGQGFQPDYVAIRRQEDLEPPAVTDRELIVLAAARLGQTRLIDNLPVTR